MKKIILAFLLGVLLIACGKDSKELVYKVGTNAEFPPYEYMEDGKIKGFDADIMDEIAKRGKFKYEWVNMNFDGLISALQSKKVDMVIAGMTLNEERQKYVNFSVPYIKPAVSLIALKSNSTTSIEEFNNKKFGVELGTIEADIIKGKFPDAIIVPFSSNTASVLALKSQKIDAILFDSKVAESYVKNNPEIKIVGEVTGEDKAMAFNLKDTEVHNKVNTILQEMLNDGTIDKLKEKYGI
ncbi:transporter substrate-binding domain-containing protein [Fusobacterium sp.]|uniref:transporter substrate-binding domain-containing protein n=1 Tax=Fusobacterium sp. TaxID=68766 RepID=UPI001D533416|nr:transporter substrate-binding domain-containing protein [Fusobacterium sp.]MBS5789965.1 transporter substrate-binding domain-containing protein [Fusobacterium sp.]